MAMLRFSGGTGTRVANNCFNLGNVSGITINAPRRPARRDDQRDPEREVERRDVAQVVVVARAEVGERIPHFLRLRRDGPVRFPDLLGFFQKVWQRSTVEFLLPLGARRQQFLVLAVVIFIRLRNVPAIDATGLHTLKDVVHRSRRLGTAVLLADVHTQPLTALGRSAVLEEIGEENLFSNFDDALTRARELTGNTATHS